MDGALRPEHEPEGWISADSGWLEERHDAFESIVAHRSGTFDALEATLAAVAELRFDGDEECIAADVEELVGLWSARLERRMTRAGVLDDPLPGTLLLLRMFFGELGFTAVTASPRDSRELEHDFVIEGRCGRPIALLLLLLAVGRRAGLPLFAAELSGRLVLACARPPRAVLFDPARDGAALSSAERDELVGASPAGQTDRVLDRLTAPALLERYLVELKQAQVREGDIAAAIEMQGRLVWLSPSDASRLQDRAWLAFQAGRHPDALSDLEKASALITDEEASADLRRQLEHVRRWIRAAG